MSRAILAFFFVFFAFFGFSASAPVPSHSSSLVERYDNVDNELLTRSLDDILADREFDTVDPAVFKRNYFSVHDVRDFDKAYHQYTKRNAFTLDEREFDDDLEYKFAKRDIPVRQRVRHAIHYASYAFGRVVKSKAPKIARFGINTVRRLRHPFRT
ncbi:hypothetical protein CPB84DRAFT_1783939 [Gymnopilus junonius]|uniref:Uncharacterized protein n=1 Tax=Gymnopilus junonius TaxID=109634 RepID=A0A9P5NL28_GYMJU|nr:hypothetical protein CPB84DRAFT_1783939 [Gymnopilus junonius]